MWNDILVDGMKGTLHFFLNMAGKLRKSNMPKYKKLLKELKKEIKQTQDADRRRQMRQIKET